MTWAEEIKASRARAGIFVCEECRDNPRENCGDTCEAEHVNELAPMWVEGWPPCQCCGAVMRLLEPLIGTGG